MSKALMMGGKFVDAVHERDEQVYGRNLFPRSRKIELRHNDHGGFLDKHSFENGVGKLTLGPGRKLTTYNINMEREKLTHGEIYTFGIDVMSEKDRDIFLDWRRSAYAQRISARKWYRISYSRPYDENDFVVLLGLSSTTLFDVETSVYYKDPKAEKGTKATDWTPAPEDLITPKYGLMII